ncbi:flagellar biosynthetic protein FliO|uniref:flagellar biosynthetic protein FliO n=1 Tax=Noviherbaspirillum sp. L7-7A TaxID=2850560 RepID=UPI001C2C8776|nr:flagellar biosynthetic protein FliO [Noviherbaspirillum sp. L7-7A]MBV0878408.1 flagellar biosynthetic protein FliO [Noviherbaspirillum sp. L7-7A]
MRLTHALILSLALAAGSAVAEEAATPAPAAEAAQPAQAQPQAPAPVASPAPAAAAAPPTGAQAPAAATVTSAPSSAGSLLQVIFGLIVVLGLLAGALWVLKRVGGGRLAGGSVVKIVGGVSVGNRERVMVVEVADQWIVIGVAPGQVSKLADMPRQEQQQGGAALTGAPNFSAWLKQTIEKRNAN